MDYQIDNFTINIDVSGNKLISAAMFITIVAKIVKNKIYIINYTNEDIKDYFTIDDSKTEEFIENTRNIVDKIVFVDNPVKNFSWLRDYMSCLTIDDFVILNGAERLLVYKETTPLLKTEYFDLKTKVHFLEEENWVGLVKELDSLYEEKQHSIQGLITNIYTDLKSREIFLKELVDSENMSIISSDSVNGNNDYEKLQRNLLEKISNLPLLEAVNAIEEERERLGDKTYKYFLAMAHYNNGNISESIEILESQYDNLLNEAKLMLADLYNAKGDKRRASEILNELYTNDKYLKDLFPTILRVYDTDDYEKHEYWLNIALEIDPDNPTIIELNANRFSNKGDYDKAAQEFRRLMNILKSPYYELVARINDILQEGKMKHEAIQKYIYEFIDLHPQLKNEAIYRLSRYFIDYRESYFPAYNTLKNSNFTVGEPRVNEIAYLKLKILKDEVKASEALRKLKPHTKEYDAKKLNKERSIELINCIRILAAEKQGYLLWRNYIDECQNDSTWKISIYERLKDAIIEINTFNIDSMISQSYIKNIEIQGITELDDDITKDSNQAICNAIIMLRRVKSGEFDLNSNFGDFDEFAKTMLTLSEVLCNNEFRLWCRYYLSIIASLLGKHQDSNNYALSILEYYDRIDESFKNHCLLLGLVSWGNSQYRLGRFTEGVACIVASINYVSSTREIYPLLEEGINVISRYISDIIKHIPKRDVELWTLFSQKVGAFNQAFKYMWRIMNVDEDEMINELREKIESSDIKDADWAGHIVNLVAVYANNKKFNEAVQIINRYYKKVIPILSGRKDVRFKILYNWSYIYFTNAKTLDDYLRVLELIELADKDLDEKRKVSHKEEKASIGSLSDEIYRFYIQICSLIIVLFEVPDYLKEIMKAKIEVILPKISPRAVIEQKNYYKNREFNEESINLKKELDQAIEEYDIIFKKNSNNIDLLSEKAETIQNLTERLKKIHPYYMELEENTKIKFTDIQKALNNDEIFYQYVITPMCITTILISTDKVIINPKLTLPIEKNVQELALEFSKCIQLYSKKEYEIENIINEISKVIADDLTDFVSKNNVRKIYCMQDLKIGMFPIVVSKINGISIIDKVASIVNIIDYTIFFKSDRKTIILKIANRIFGNPEEPELKKINTWLESKKSEYFIILENKTDEINLKPIPQSKGANSVAIYAHGVPDPNGSVIDGAKGLHGRNRIISLEDIIEKFVDIDNLILISCRAGSPYFDSAESSYGTWSAIFERFTGNILSCKWDVSTNHTIELMDELYTQTMKNSIAIDEALLIAQKKMKEKYNNPYYWAGVDLWIN